MKYNYLRKEITAWNPAESGWAVRLSPQPSPQAPAAPAPARGAGGAGGAAPHTGRGRCRADRSPDTTTVPALKRTPREKATFSAALRLCSVHSWHSDTRAQGRQEDGASPMTFAHFLPFSSFDWSVLKDANAVSQQLWSSLALGMF